MAQQIKGLLAAAASTATRIVAALAAALLPSLAAAQAAPGPWRYSASLYAFLPKVDASTSVPADAGGTPINIGIVESLQFMFMGAFEAHNGAWGVFTDFIYLDFAGGKSGSRDFTIGNIGLPASTSADLDWDLKGWAWTLAGEYRLLSQPGAVTLDLLGGARLFDVRTNLRWNISGDLGPIAPGGRSGSRESKDSLWDGIVGLKGRVPLGAGGRWQLPFYADVGAGESKLTWQLAAGLGYAFGWGDAVFLWRHLAYEMKSGYTLKDISFGGPLLGATFHW